MSNLVVGGRRFFGPKLAAVPWSRNAVGGKCETNQTLSPHVHGCIAFSINAAEEVCPIRWSGPPFESKRERVPIGICWSEEEAVWNAKRAVWVDRQLVDLFCLRLYCCFPVVPWIIGRRMGVSRLTCSLYLLASKMCPHLIQDVVLALLRRQFPYIFGFNYLINT